MRRDKTPRMNLYNYFRLRAFLDRLAFRIRFGSDRYERLLG